MLHRQLVTYIDTTGKLVTAFIFRQPDSTDDRLFDIQIAHSKEIKRNISINNIIIHRLDTSALHIPGIPSPYPDADFGAIYYWNGAISGKWGKNNFYPLQIIEDSKQGWKMQNLMDLRIDDKYYPPKSFTKYNPDIHIPLPDGIR